MACFVIIFVREQRTTSSALGRESQSYCPIFCPSSIRVGFVNMRSGRASVGIFAPHQLEDVCPATDDLTSNRPTWMAELQWNRVSNMEPSGPYPLDLTTRPPRPSVALERFFYLFPPHIYNRQTGSLKKGSEFGGM
ncbi:hypothetical protein AVEN_5200-1 [Araneus ventricosus]|uniref:Uncharacterized protein n=1 Tax=Araneus ventricosus TaxID=182803 RepID=A0A4Y2I6M3_ARAVE|nr:hypothetical protein AVEN_5200-1 [Araneus ventricosus]